MASNPRKLTDEQLVSAVLDIADPMVFEGISFEKPDPELPPQILGEYHFGAGHDAIWCCHCQARRPRNGFVIENETGRRYLIGSHCGPKHYNLSFGIARRHHNEMKARQGVLARMAAICASATALTQARRDILRSDEMRSLDAKRSELKAAAPSAVSLLATYTQNGSPLTEMVRVRDLDAERRRDESLPIGQSGPPLYREEPQSLGMVAGRGLVRRRDCRDALLDLKQAIEAVEATARGITDNVSTVRITAAVRKVEEAWRAAEAAIKEAELSTAFFSSENISRLERWSATHRNYSFNAADGGLVVEERGTKTLVRSLPAIVLGAIPKLSA